MLRLLSLTVHPIGDSLDIHCRQLAIQPRHKMTAVCKCLRAVKEDDEGYMSERPRLLNTALETT